MKLYYLPIRARAEPIRMTLAYGNIQYDDIICPFIEWPEMKAKGDIPLFGQLPSLVTDSGLTISQSGAILRYVAKLANVQPVTNEDAAIADMVIELGQEMNLINPLLCWFEPGSTIFEEKKAEYFASLPGNLDAITKILGDKAFITGAAPCHADFFLFHILLNTLSVDPQSISGHSKVLEWTKRVQSLPAIEKYLNERPSKLTPGFGKPGSLILQ